MKKSKSFTEMSIDVSLAETVWNMMDYVEHSAKPIERVAFHMSESDDGHTHAGFTDYESGDEDDDTVVAVIGVDPTIDEGAEIEDDELRRAMRFMYFYQAAYISIEHYIADHCSHHHD